MRKKSGFTIVEQAIELVPEFENVVHKLDQQVALRGQRKSTLHNYIRRIALCVTHFGKLPDQIDPEEINEYLVSLTRDPKSPSRSSFKHMVYGLRYYYRLPGMNKNAIALPSLKKDTKLSVILNQSELKELFSAPSLLKQGVELTLIYSACLRGQEVNNQHYAKERLSVYSIKNQLKMLLSAYHEMGCSSIPKRREFIAGSCRPLRVIFIVARYLFFLSF